MLSGNDNKGERWQLYKIRDAAWSSGRSVFSVQQLAHLVGKPKTVAVVYASRLVRADLAVRIRRGTIAFEDDDAITATQLIEPSYVSLTSALRFHGLVTQMPRATECVTTRNSLRLPGIIYHKIPPSLLYGFKKHPKGHSYALIAEPEKAVLDGLYLRTFTERDLRELVPAMDIARLRHLAKRFRGKGRARLERMVDHA